MNKREFLKSLAAGAITTALPPVEIVPPVAGPDNREGILIDIRAIQDVEGLCARDVIALYMKTGILVYSSEQGVPPVPLNTPVPMVDIDQLEDEN